MYTMVRSSPLMRRIAPFAVLSVLCGCATPPAGPIVMYGGTPLPESETARVWMAPGLFLFTGPDSGLGDSAPTNSAERIRALREGAAGTDVYSCLRSLAFRPGKYGFHVLEVDEFRASPGIVPILTSPWTALDLNVEAGKRYLVGGTYYTTDSGKTMSGNVVLTNMMLAVAEQMVGTRKQSVALCRHEKSDHTVFWMGRGEAYDATIEGKEVKFKTAVIDISDAVMLDVKAGRGNRLLAVNTCSKRELLETVAGSDSDLKVRQAAAQRLKQLK